jgi:murein DD-endopeptidase MepM/ murein hydrolase activator NlpD
MPEEIKNKRSRWEKLKDTYRLVILNDDTFEELGSYRLSLLNVYVLLSTVIVLTMVVVVMAMAFTPIRRLIPGYMGGNNRTEMVKLYNDLDSLEELVIAQEKYNESFRKMLTNNVQYIPSESEQPKKEPTKVKPAEKSKEEEDLRNEVEMAEIRAVVGDATSRPAVSRDIPLEQMYFTAPVSGSVSAAFRPENKHYGVDVIAPKNTPVRAVMDGWVMFSDWTLETGNSVAIQHANNLVSFYKHNSVLLKKTGSYVRNGEAIAIIGNTGELSDGPHLHFELWHRGKPVNPTDFMTFK